MSNRTAARAGIGGTMLRSRSLGSLLDANIPTREPILGTWLTQRHLSMLYAPAGVGKSMATFSIALAVAGGGKFLEWATPKPRKVLLVDGEMDVADLKERAALLLQALPQVDLEAARVNLEVFAQQDQHPEAQFPDLATPEGRAEIVKRAKAHKAELVILDNFSTLVTVEDENAASSFNPVVELMQRLKSNGCAVILVHHARKGGGNGKVSEGNYRGTSKMAVIFNSIIALSHPGGIASRTGTAFAWHFEKFRGMRDGTVGDFQATLTAGPVGDAAWTHEASTENLVVELVALVRSVRCQNREELAAALGVSTGTISALKLKAIGQGLISAADWDQCLRMAREGAPEETSEDF
ncbi:MAG TPA: AAA family ATPase [Aliidongia sp.]|nr:AAA family ATPase [Aliidongia sp.]